MPNLFNNQYANLASKGRFGDTMLAHINPQEAGLLKSMGGAGTINPQTGLREFYTAEQAIPQSVLDALPKQLEKQTIYTPRMGGFNESQVVVPPPNAIPITATQSGMGGPREVPTGEYYLPLDNIPNYPKTDALGYPVPPLVAKYDASGNLQTITTQTRYAVDENYRVQPEYNLKGELVSTGLVDNREGEGGGFGDFLQSAVKDFAPMIALGLGANYLAGSGLFAGGAGAVGGATAADIAASNALAQANLGGYAGTAFSAIPSGVGAGLLGGGAAGSGSPLTGFGTGQLGADIAATELAAAAVDPLAAANISGGLTTDAVAKAAAAGGAGSTVSPSMLQSIADATGISVDTLKTFGPSVIQGLIGAGGSALTANQATNAAKTQADAQIRAAQIAADAARFRPVGVTTRFGSSNFQTDAQGNVIGAGYTPSPEILGYQNRLSALANQGLTGAEGAQAAYAPLTGAAQNLFSLGQSYLAKTPEQAAQEYITKQQALLAPSQENQLAQLQNKLFQQGRIGSATAQGGNLMATNPEMAAYYNSLAQSNLALAAQADQEARNRIQFGAGLFDTGAGLQGRYYTGQTAALAPFTNVMDVTTGLENLAQQPMTLGTQIGAKTTAGAAQAGMLTGQGITSAASTMAPANAYSFGGNVLAGAANSPVLASAVNRAFGNTPPAQQQYTFNPTTGQYVPVQQFVA
jgi:hypothetical protein